MKNKSVPPFDLKTPKKNKIPFRLCAGCRVWEVAGMEKASCKEKGYICREIETLKPCSQKIAAR